MLDEAEFAKVISRAEVEKTVQKGSESDVATKADLHIKWFASILEKYETITGFHETNVNAIWHHRISTYGPPCDRCGKVLRTPVASKCFECGLPKAVSRVEI